MKLINPNVEQWHCGYTLPEIWSHIAKCARVCYQSEPRNNGETDKEFIDRVILHNNTYRDIAESRGLQLKLHLSCLEHGTVYLDVPYLCNKEKLGIFFSNTCAKFKSYKTEDVDDNYNIAITTNMRFIIENGRTDLLKYICAPTEHHYLRTTFNIITDIGVARELARHRTHSISEESTRYCNYSKDKFGNELTFIKPEWLNMYDEDEGREVTRDWNFDVLDGCAIIAEESKFDDARDAYLTSISVAEHCYKELLENGWTPQQARQILPLSTKVQTIHTAFDTDWFEFIELRADGCSGSVHPNMKVIATKIKDLMNKEDATV